MSEHVVDSSAILALIFDEPGADVVRPAIHDGALLSTVNLSEVVAKLADQGRTQAQIALLLAPIRLQVIEFSSDHAWRAGMLRPVTRSLGLSSGDRSCLALGQAKGLPVLTADRVWAQLDVGVEVVVCR